MARKKPGSGEAAFIDLNLRIKQDGGPLYGFLQGIENPHARGDRVRQLLYLGLLVERGAGIGNLAGMPPVAASPITPTSSPTPEKKASASKQPDASSPDEVLQFQADDLSAIFGS
jgi:hypothetical protein